MRATEIVASIVYGKAVVKENYGVAVTTDCAF
jgi:hypothetical protein